jgi:uncharacterized membrane protein YedE/YeeE
VALYALINQPLGSTAAYGQVLAFVQRRVSEPSRVWFFVGLLGGGLLAAFLRGGPKFHLEYGMLSAVVPLVALIPLLFAGGLLMGYGARWAGGCTSGHGLRGSSSLSPASLAATGTFMAVAVALTLALHALTGGAL